MQCSVSLDYYYDDDYDYGYDYESCEDIIIEDLSSAADCADLCYDDWDCADWDFVEDEMKCVHKQFVSIVCPFLFLRNCFFNHFIGKNLILTLISLSV